MKAKAVDFTDRLAQRGIDRRDFLKFCGVMAATLALPRTGITRISKALAATPRPPVVWLEFQDCTGDTESFLRASQPSVDEFLLDRISLDYHETLMAPAGDGTELSLSDTIRTYPGEYIAIVEGSIPTANGGTFCMVRGRTALSILQKVAASARYIVAAGSCAYDGGLAAAAPNPTGATGVAGAIPNPTNLINLPGCPTNVMNISAALVYILTYGDLPPWTEAADRPLLTAVGSTNTVSGGSTTTAIRRFAPGAMQDTAWGGAWRRWGAAGLRPVATVTTSNGMTGRVGPSGPGTPAWDAPTRISGTR